MYFKISIHLGFWIPKNLVNFEVHILLGHFKKHKQLELISKELPKINLKTKQYKFFT